MYAKNIFEELML